MGQNSSQLVAVEEQATLPDRPPQGKKPKSKKSKRRSTGNTVIDINEEDSARALMQMRGEDFEHVRGHSEVYAPALGQSMIEKNSLVQSLGTFEDADKSKKRKRSNHSEKTRKKRRRSGSFVPQDAENLYSHSDNGIVALPRSDELGESYQWLETWINSDINANSIYTEVNDVPASTLDQIPSDDEDIATFLRDFQEQEENTSTPPLDTQDQLEGEPIDVLASTIPSTSPVSHAKRKKNLVEVSDLVIHSSQSSLSSILREIGDKQLEESCALLPFPKDKKADFVPQQPHTDINVEGNNNLPGGTGQHTLASDSNIDFEAFDNYCLAYGLGSANVFDDPSGKSPPVKPELMADCVESIRARQDTVADSEDGISPPRHKHRRRVSPSTNQKTTREDDPLVSSSLANDGLYLLNDEQSDQVLPGLEDMQYSSQEYHNLVTQPGSSAQSASSDDFCEPINDPLDAKEEGGKSSSRSSCHGKKSQITSPEEEQTRSEGKFTSAEISKLEKFRDNYCAERDITIWQFNHMIHSAVRESPKAKEMWQEIYEIIPYRKKVTIQRFCRRRFHNFETRGSWTEEDDKALVRAVEEKGKSWKAVGQIMERHPEDVRDRWRNYHVNAENRNKERWTDMEITNLAMAVHDCMQIMKDAKRSAKLRKYEGRDVPESETDSDEEAMDAKLINWQVVSDRMHGTRSRLQCSFKWGKLKKEARNQALRQAKAAQKNLENMDQEQRPVQKDTWRQKRAQRRVMEMRPGDIYDLLHAISSCQAAQEGNIPWSSLGDDAFRNRWSTMERKAAWAMFRGSVLVAEDVYYQDIVNHLLNNLLTNAGASLDERWDPEVHGYGQAPPPKTAVRTASEKEKKRQEKLQKARDKRKAKVADRGPNEHGYRTKIKSSLLVASTDDEDGESDIGDERDPASISNESRRSSEVSRVPAARRLTTSLETANTTVDGSSEENSVTQQFSNELARQLQQSLA